jgi:DHA1 family tetracycline resistance protein-like MFS transporter
VLVTIPDRPGTQAIAFIAITLLLDTIGFGLIVPVLPSLLSQITGEDVSHAAIYGGYLSFLYASM